MKIKEDKLEVGKFYFITTSTGYSSVGKWTCYYNFYICGSDEPVLYEECIYVSKYTSLPDVDWLEKLFTRAYNKMNSIMEKEMVYLVKLVIIDEFLYGDEE